MPTTSTTIRHMPLECNNIPTDKLLFPGSTSDIHWTSFGNNLNMFLNLQVDLPVALLLPLGM